MYQTQLSSTESLELSKHLVAAILTLVYVHNTYLILHSNGGGGVDHKHAGMAGYLPRESSADDPFRSTLKMGSNPNYLPMACEMGCRRCEGFMHLNVCMSLPRFHHHRLTNRCTLSRKVPCLSSLDMQLSIVTPCWRH